MSGKEKVVILNKLNREVIEDMLNRDKANLIYSVSEPASNNTTMYHDFYLNNDEKYFYVNDYLGIKEEATLSKYKLTVNGILTSEEYKEKFGVEKNKDIDLRQYN